MRVLLVSKHQINSITGIINTAQSHAIAQVKDIGFRKYFLSVVNQQVQRLRYVDNNCPLCPKGPLLRGSHGSSESRMIYLALP